MTRRTLFLAIIPVAILVVAALWSSAPTPVAASETTATVSFSTHPDRSEIDLDNVRLGLSPLNFWTVEAGTHHVRFTHPGHSPVSYDFTVTPGQKRTLYATLHRRP